MTRTQANEPGFTDEAIGRDIVNTIEAAREVYDWLADWTPAERYGELITDLLDIAFPDDAELTARREVAEAFTRNYLLERDEACGFVHPDDSADPEDERRESAREIIENIVAAAPIVPSPAYGVKNRDIKELWVAHGGSQHGPRVETYTIPEVAFWKFIDSLRERLSSAPVEEADAKAGALVDKYCEGFCKGSGRPGVFDDCTGCEIARLAHPASTIPSEPEAKGEAGAGPVGEAVATFETWAEGYQAPDWAMGLARSAWDAARAHPVDEPGEVERLTRERDDAKCEIAALTGRLAAAEESASLRHEEGTRYLVGRETAEASLAEMRERLEQVTSERDNALAAAKMLSGSLSSAHAEMRKRLEKIDAQEVGR